MHSEPFGNLSELDDFLLDIPASFLYNDIEESGNDFHPSSFIPILVTSDV